MPLRHRGHLEREERDRGELDKRSVDDTKHGHLWHRLDLRPRDHRHDGDRLDDGSRWHDDLALNSKLLLPANISEKKEDLGFRPVWTNTLPDGTTTSEMHDCQSFSSPNFEDEGYVGFANKTDAQWTHAEVLLQRLRPTLLFQPRVLADALTKQANDRLYRVYDRHCSSDV